MISSYERIVRYYTEADEDSRLRTGYFQLEYERTRELLLRHLPPPPATIIDVGGGSGTYAGWLAKQGYQVHLIDPVPKHVEQARATSSRQNDHPLASAEIGDARHLPQQDGFADALLLLGPLYHLIEKEDRFLCLREAHRVVKRGGRIWGSAISRFAPVLDSVSHGFFADPTFLEILHRDIEEGQHRNRTNNPLYFTDAFLHRPEDLRYEFTEAGFQVVEIVGIEGPGWLSAQFDELWNNPRQRDRLVSIAKKMEHEPSIIGASAHIMAIGQK